MTNEAILFIPPALCDASAFLPQIIGMSRKYTVQCAFTAYSDRFETTASCILDHAPTRFALVGMGMGGMLALEIFRRCPERVNRIALISTNPQADSPDIAARREPLIVAARTGRMDDVIEAELSPQTLTRHDDWTHIAQLVIDMAHQAGPNTYIKHARAMQRRKDQQDILRKIKVPALVMTGKEDHYYTPRRHEFMASMIPYARCELIENAAHLPTLEQPEATTSLLLDWMGEPLVLR